MTSPAAPIGIGVIGAGGISRSHAQAIQMLPEARLMGFCDLNPAAAAKAAAQFGGRAYGSLEEMLADPQVAVVTVATPSGAHGAAVVAAAQAGKHVFCEKPLEITPSRAEAMVRACQDNHVLLAAVFQNRTLPGVQRIRQAIQAGRLGKMVMASVRMNWYRDAAYYRTDWRGTKALDGGGALINQGIHYIDLLLFLNGDPLEVYGVAGAQTHQIEVEDTACVTLRFRNGSFGTIAISTACPPGFPAQLELYGEKGSVALVEGQLSRWNFLEEDPEDEAVRQEIARSATAAPAAVAPPPEGHARQLRNLLAAIRGEEPLLVDGQEGCRALKVISAIYESCRTGRPCRLDNSLNLEK